MTERRDRRATGAVLGGVIGLAYLLVGQLVNRIALPGVPLYQPPLGLLGNVLLAAVVGAALGGLIAWPESPSIGIAAGCAASWAGIVLATAIRLGSGSAGTILSLILSVPLAWAAAPVILAVRWATDRQVEARRNGVPLRLRARIPAGLTVIVMLLALPELLPAGGRTELRLMHEMMQAGQAATSLDAVPAPLRGPAVTSFPAGRQVGYALEWTAYDLDRFIELRPASNYTQHAAVIAHFRAGPRLVCLYPTPKTAPICGTYP